MNGIRGTGLATTAAVGAPRLLFFSSDELKIPDDGDNESPSHSPEDDEETLESLPRDDGNREDSNKTNEDPNNEGKAFQRDNQEFPAFSSLPDHHVHSVLEDCLLNNPIKTLSDYYTTRRMNEGIKSSFQEVRCDVGKNNPFWTSKFTCPISRTVYLSGLPGPLLADNPGVALVEMATKVFGEYKVIDHQQVAFSTKKAAKRSVALAALLDVTGTYASLTSRPTKIKQQTFPGWVNDLYRFGIRATDLNITYREGACPPTNAGWQCQPTLLHCVLEIEGPTRLTIEGGPHPTKKATLERAVFELGNHMSRRTSYTAVIDTGGNDFEAKKRLLLCDSAADASYTVSIPAWANAPIPDGDKSEAIFYMYELEFESESGNQFVEERSGIDDSITTPLGIAFPMNVQPLNHDGVFETNNFFVKQKDGKRVERVIVRLRKRYTFNLNEMEDSHVTVADRINWMIEFNRILSWWNTYGFTKAQHIEKQMQTLWRRKEPRDNINQRSIGSSPEKDSSPNDRTYFFVPLTRDHEDPIDWKLLQRIASNESLPYMEPVRDDWRILRCIGNLALWIATYQLVAVGLAVFTPWLFRSAKEYFAYPGIWPYRRLESLGVCCGVKMLIASLVVAKIRIIPPPRKPLSRDIFVNHFLVQRGASTIVYVAHNEIDENAPFLTGLSPLASEGGKIQSTYADYYKKKYSIILQYPQETLIAAKRLLSHADHDFLLAKDAGHPISHLIPELIHVLPMPRNLIYLARQIGGFMPLIEREIQLVFASEAIQGLSNKALETSASSASLVPLLREATTLFPESMYQRLEFLGDSVLGFFVAVATVTSNSALAMTFDDIEKCLTKAIKNHSLYSAGLRMGVNHLLFMSERQRKWRSKYAGTRGLNKSLMSCHESIADSIISDAVETYWELLSSMNRVFLVICQAQTGTWLPQFSRSFNCWLRVEMLPSSKVPRHVIFWVLV